MAFRIEHLDCIYGKDTAFESYALRDVSFTLPDGRFTGLIGHTGSGKSTLIQHLNGLIKAEPGKIFWDGQDISAQDYDRRKLRFEVGLVFQYPEHQLFEAEVLDDVLFGPKNEGLAPEEALKRAVSALKSVGIDESYYKKSPFELSGGQKRRVAIAGVLAMEPRLLILDEPTAGLDPRGRDEILDCVKRLNTEKGVGILLVSHSMEDVARYADHLLVMSEGRLVREGTPREVFTHEEELKSIGLSVPKVCTVLRNLRERGIPAREGLITVEEARDEILRLAKERGKA